MTNTMETQPTTLLDVGQFILRADDDDINAIVGLINDRRKMLKIEQQATAKATFMVGDIVELTGLSPKYMNGERVIIRSMIGAKFKVVLAEGSGHRAVTRFGRGEFSAPSQCLRAVR